MSERIGSTVRRRRPGAARPVPPPVQRHRHLTPATERRVLDRTGERNRRRPVVGAAPLRRRRATQTARLQRQRQRRGVVRQLAAAQRAVPPPAVADHPHPSHRCMLPRERSIRHGSSANAPSSATPLTRHGPGAAEEMCPMPIANSREARQRARSRWDAPHNVDRRVDALAARIRRVVSTLPTLTAEQQQQLTEAVTRR